MDSSVPLHADRGDRRRLRLHLHVSPRGRFHNIALVMRNVGIKAGFGFGGLREVRVGARKRNLVQRIWLQSAHQTEVEVAPAGGSGPGAPGRKSNPSLSIVPSR